MSTIFGYCRVSTKTQNIERQERNIRAEFPNAVILKEAFTGTKMDRPQWNRLMRSVKSGDTIVFDSVSRMSRNADEGIKVYFQLIDDGVTLKFLNEPYVDSNVYLESRADKIALLGTDEDEIFKGLNNYFRRLAERQLRIAFEQAQKEVDDLHERTRQGMVTARLNGKQIGKPKGSHKATKKEQAIKPLMLKRLACFGGNLSDKDFISMKHDGFTVSEHTFYKYKAELVAEQAAKENEESEINLGNPPGDCQK